MRVAKVAVFVVVLLALLNVVVLAQQNDESLEKQGWESLGFFLDGNVVSKLAEKNGMIRRRNQILNILTRIPDSRKVGREFGDRKSGNKRRGYMSPKRSDSFMKRIREEYNRKNKGPRAGQRGYMSPKRSDSFMKKIRSSKYSTDKQGAIKPISGDSREPITIGREFIGFPRGRLSPGRSDDHMRRIREGRTSSQHYQHLTKPAVINRTKPFLVKPGRLSPGRSDNHMRRIREGRTSSQHYQHMTKPAFMPGRLSPGRSDNHMRRIREGRTSSQHYQHLNRPTTKPMMVGIRDLARYGIPQPISTKPFLVQPGRLSPVRSDNHMRRIREGRTSSQHYQHLSKPAVMPTLRFRR